MPRNLSSDTGRAVAGGAVCAPAWPASASIIPTASIDLIVTPGLKEPNRMPPILPQEWDRACQMSGLGLLLPDDVDRDLHGRNRSSVLEPVDGVPVLGPAHSRAIVRRDTVSMVRDRPLQDVDGAWPVFVVVNRAEDA